MSDPAIICVAITGSVPRRSDNPAVPITVAEQVASTRAAFEAGAAIAHCHVRDDDETPSADPGRFAELKAGIEDACPGMIVQLSTGGRSGAGRARGGCIALRPDMCSLSVGSNNFPTRVYENPPDLVDWLASEMAAHGVVPEIECFDLSHLYQAAAMHADGRLAGRPYCQFVMGVRNAMPVDRVAFDAMRTAHRASLRRRALVRRRDRRGPGGPERLGRRGGRALAHGAGGQHPPGPGAAGALERRAGRACRRDRSIARPAAGDLRRGPRDPRAARGVTPGRSFVRVGAALLHAHWREGRGPAAVFANSLGTDLRLWDGAVALLPPDAPVLRWDVRGHGLSDGPPATMDEHAADLAALMDRAGIAGAVICGVSMGGMVALTLARDRPDLVGGAVLACTGARIGTVETWDARIAAVREGGIGPIAEDVIARWLSPHWRAAHPDAAAGWRLMLERTPAEGYAAACAAIRDADLRGAAAGLVVPATCLAGSEDTATPPSVVEELASLIPGADLAVLDGVGHLPPIEAPGDVVRAILAVRERMT